MRSVVTSDWKCGFLASNHVFSLGGNMRQSMGSRTTALWAAGFILAAGWQGRALAQAMPGKAAGPALEQPPQSAATPAPVAVETPPSRSGERHPFALLLHLGPYSGFGAGVAVGTNDVGLRASVGWTPLLLVIDAGSTVDFQFYSSFQISPDLYVRLLSPRPTTHIGLLGGYRYSSLLGHGLAFGGYAQFGLGRVFDGLISAGFLVYPDGEDRLKREEHLPSGTQFSFPGPSVNFGVSLGLAFFP